MKYKTILYEFILTIFFSSCCYGSKGGPIAVSGSFSSSSSSSSSSASSSSSSGSFTLSGNIGANEIGGLKSYASAIDANAGSAYGGSGNSGFAGAGLGVGAQSAAGAGTYSSAGAGTTSGVKTGPSSELNVGPSDGNVKSASGSGSGSLSGCCKGPFPGPQGSIHDSKPASSVPAYQNNNLPVPTHPAPISPIPTISTVSAGAGVGILGHSFQPESLLSIITSFPGPTGSIHSSKPATGEPTYKNPTIVATVPISNGGNNYNFNYKPTSHTPISTSVISSLPGPQGSIHTSKPVVSGPSEGFGNQPIQPQQPISPGQPSVINSFPAAPGDIHTNKPIIPGHPGQGFVHQPVFPTQKPISGGNPTVISTFPSAPGDIHTSKPAPNPSFVNQPNYPSTPGNISPSLISSFPGSTENIHSNKPSTSSPSFINQPTSGNIPISVISSFPAGPGNNLPNKPTQIFTNQQPGLLPSNSLLPPTTGGSYNTGSSVASSGSSAVGAGLTGTFIASLPGPPGSIHQSTPVNTGNYVGNNYRPIVGPNCSNKPGQSCQNPQNQLPSTESATNSPYGTLNQNRPSPPNNDHPIVGPICYNKPGHNCQNTQNPLPASESGNAPFADTNQNSPLPPNNGGLAMAPICFNKLGQNCQTTQNQLPSLESATDKPFTTTTDQHSSSLPHNEPSIESNCSYQPGATNPCKLLPTNLLPPSFNNENVEHPTPVSNLDSNTPSNSGAIPKDQSNNYQPPISNTPGVVETTTHLSPEPSSENSKPGVESPHPGCNSGSGSCGSDQKTDNLQPSTNNENVPTTDTVQSSYQPLKPGQVVTTGHIISGGPGLPFVPDGSFPTISQDILPPYTTILNHPGLNKPCCQGPYPGPDGSIHDSKPATSDSNSNLNDGSTQTPLNDGDKKINPAIIFMDHNKDNLGSGSYSGSSASGTDDKNSGFATGNVLIQKADGSVSGGTDKSDVNGQYTGDGNPNTPNANIGSGFATGNVLIQKDTDKPLDGNDGFVVVIQKEEPNTGGSGSYGTTSITSYGPLRGSGDSNAGTFGHGGSYASVGTYGTGNAGGHGESYGCSTGKCKAGGVVSGTGGNFGSAYGNSFAGGYGFGGSSGGGGNFGSPEQGIRELGNLFNNLFGKNNFATSSGSGSFSKSGSYAGASSFAGANAGSFAGHY